MKVLVSGGRDYKDETTLFRVLDEIHAETPITQIIQGGARGADALARKWAMLRHVPNVEYKANWKRYAGAAGPIRNQQMLDEAQPNLVVAFPTGGPGTRHMIESTRKVGISVRII